MGVNPISPDVFQGGQMTDLPAFTGTLDGTELLEIVAAPTGQSNEAAGVNYQINSQLLAQLLVFMTFKTVIIGNGQYTNPAAPYVVLSGDQRVYVNKTVPSPTYVQLALASTYIAEPLIKDVAGTVDVGSEITTTFTGGQQADGHSPVVIGVPYGGYFFRPVLNQGKWTLGSA